MLVSILVGAGIDYSYQPQVGYNTNDVFGHIAAGVVMTFACMPFYGAASLIKRWLRWTEWSRLLIVASLSLSLFLVLFLSYSPKESGLYSLRHTLEAAMQCWLFSLAYGIPSTIARTYAIQE